MTLARHLAFAAGVFALTSVVTHAASAQTFSDRVDPGHAKLQRVFVVRRLRASDAVARQQPRRSQPQVRGAPRRHHQPRHRRRVRRGERRAHPARQRQRGVQHDDRQSRHLPEQPGLQARLALRELLRPGALRGRDVLRRRVRLVEHQQLHVLRVRRAQVHGGQHRVCAAQRRRHLGKSDHREPPGPSGHRGNALPHEQQRRARDRLRRRRTTSRAATASTSGKS